MHGGDGDDTFHFGGSQDTAFGDAGNDVFMLGFGDGDNTADGGAGGDWTDVIRLDGVGTGPGSGDWTVVIDQGSIVESNADNLVLFEDAAGTVTLSDGSSIDFEGIERIEW